MKGIVCQNRSAKTTTIGNVTTSSFKWNKTQTLPRKTLNFVFKEREKSLVTVSSSTSMQNMKSTGRSRIMIQGVEMGRIRVGFRD